MNTVLHRFRLVFNLIASDLYRYYGNTRFKTFVYAYFFNRSFNYSFWLRLAGSKLHCICIIAAHVHCRKSRVYGIHIPVEVEIGQGLYIAHGMPVVVNPTAKIGHNCNLSQFVTIGSNHGAAAVIGDNVYIGPSVCIVENVKIGSDSIIGAGAVVVRDVQANTTVAGVPARCIGPNKHKNYIGNRWVQKHIAGER